MRTISTKDIARAIYESSKEKRGKELEEHLQNIVKFLSKRRMLSRKTEILEKLEEELDRDLGAISVKVESASKITNHAREDLVKILKKRYSAKGVKLSEKVREDLISGIKIQVGDEVIDLSLKNKVKKLKEHFAR